MRIIAALAFALISGSAVAQSVQQSSTVTPGHPPVWITDGVIGDGGVPANGALTGIGVTAQGPGICQNSGTTSQPYNQVCLNVTPTGGGFTFNNFGGATGSFSVTVNGVPQSFVNAILPTTPNASACFANAFGELQNCAGGGSSLIVGGTGITGGATNGILFNAGGLLGNLATGNSGVLVTDGSGNPSIGTVLPFVVSPATGGTGINNGTNTATFGGAFSTSAALAITAGGANQVAIWTGTNAMGGLSTANNGVLATNGSGVPSITGTLPFTVTTATGGTGQTSFTANLPLIGNGAGALAQGTISGNLTKFATTSITSAASGNCVSVDGSGNLVSAGGPCTTGGGGGTVASSTTGQVPVYTAATTVTGAVAMTYSAGTLTLGTANTTPGSVVLEGSISGAVTQVSSANAGTPTITWGTNSGTPMVTATAPLVINTATGNGSITGAAGQVLAGVGPAFTPTPVLGVNGSLAGSLGLASAAVSGGTVTVQNTSATSAYNLNVPATPGTTNQINTSGGGGATPNSWQNIAALLLPGAGVAISGTTAATISCTVSTISVSGCVKPDGNSITVTAGILSGAAFVFYPACTTNGTVECSTAINTAITACAGTNGGKIVLPPGTILDNGGINMTSGGCDLSGGGTYQEFTGAAGAQTYLNFPTQGTVIYQTSSTNCAITSGGNHVYIHDISFRQNQPADTNGFSPTTYQPSICNSSQADIERVFFWNVYTGIQVGIAGSQSSGRTRISNVSGTCFFICFDIQSAADFGWVKDAFCEPFANPPGGVNTGQFYWHQQHSVCVHIQSVSEWTFANINATYTRYGIWEQPSASDNPPNAAWVHVDGFHCDTCIFGIEISGCAQMSFSDTLILGAGTIAGSVGVDAAGTGSCTTSNNILKFSNLTIHGTGNQCISANTVDLSVTNYECFAFNSAATGSAGTTMNVAVSGSAGSIFTVGGRYNVNNQGNTGGGGSGGAAQSGSGLFQTSHAN